MSLASATFFYGVTVNMLDLSLAAQAHAVIAPTLLAVDLIVARRRQGRLEASGTGTSAVCKIPTEIWSLVKEVVAREAVADKVDELMRSVDDPHCECYNCVKRREKGHHDGQRFDLGAFDLCDARWDRFFAAGGLFEYYELHKQSVKAFLASYALCKPHPDVLNDELSSYANCDLAAACTIGIPLARRDDDWPSSCIVGVEQGDTAPRHCVHRFSPTAFDLPADARERFHRLLAVYPTIQPVSLAEGTVISAQEKARRQGLAPMTREELMTEEEAAARVPSWLLVSQGGLS